MNHHEPTTITWKFAEACGGSSFCTHHFANCRPAKIHHKVCPRASSWPFLLQSPWLWVSTKQTHKNTECLTGGIRWKSDAIEKQQWTIHYHQDRLFQLPRGRLVGLRNRHRKNWMQTAQMTCLGTALRTGSEDSCSASWYLYIVPCDLQDHKTAALQCYINDQRKKNQQP